MKKIIILLCACIVVISAAQAQFKSQLEQQPSAARSLVHPASSISSFFGLLSPENFMMRHNFSLNYMISGGSGASLASYTNSMFYKIADPLNVRFDVTLQGSPFGQYGSLSQNELSTLYISRAELNYQPSENVFVKLQYRQLPFGYYYGHYNPFSTTSQWGGE